MGKGPFASSDSKRIRKTCEGGVSAQDAGRCRTPIDPNAACHRSASYWA